MACVSGESVSPSPLHSELHCVPAMGPPRDCPLGTGLCLPRQIEGQMLLGAFAFMFSELMCAVGEDTRMAGTCVGVRCLPGAPS